MSRRSSWAKLEVEVFLVEIFEYLVLQTKHKNNMSLCIRTMSRRVNLAFVSEAVKFAKL